VQVDSILTGARRCVPTTAAGTAAPARRVAVPTLGGGHPTGDGTGAPGVVGSGAKDPSVFEGGMRDAAGVDADGSAAEAGGGARPLPAPPPAAHGKDTDGSLNGGEEGVLTADSKEGTGSE